MIVCHCRGLSDFALRAAGIMPRGSHCSEACRSECQRIVGRTPRCELCGAEGVHLNSVGGLIAACDGCLEYAREAASPAQRARRCARWVLRWARGRALRA